MKIINEFLFNRNLFERIIFYILFSILFAKIYSELILGQAVYYNPRIKQWVFYILLMLDYAYNIRKILSIKVSFNAMSGFALTIFFMIIHGLAVGISLGNPWFLVFNDTVPFLMIALNILRMQSKSEESKPIDFQFLLNFSSAISLFSSLLSFALLKAGVIDRATLTVHLVYIVIFCAAIISNHKIRMIDIAIFLTVFMLGINQMNRTTMLFFVLIALFLFAKLAWNNWRKAIGFMILATTILTIGFYSLPEDSPTYRRIIGIQNIDFSKRTGSVGERQQEADSVNIELKQLGKTHELLGLGMGGSFTMRTTYETIENYGHAHFSWVWFKMRFGEVGYIYLMLFCLALIYNLISGIKIGGSVATSVSLICLFSLLYFLTYTNAVLLLCGIQFLYLGRLNEKSSQRNN